MGRRCRGAVLLWRFVVGFVPVDPAASSMAVRLGLGTVALLPGAGALAAMVLAQMGLRVWYVRVDPLAGEEPLVLRRNQRCIGNSVEQFLIFVPALLAVSAGVPGPRMPEVVALGVVFGVARVVFWLGYLVDPVGRAPGMVATMACNAAAMGAAAWIWL